MSSKPSLIDRLKNRWEPLYQYCTTGVWTDTRTGWRVRLVKTINLSVRSLMSSDLQSQAAAMTYRTLLAIVPALALLFAIARGFGLQDLIVKQLYRMFPSQEKLIATSTRFVDSYLNQASEGLFVGVGIVFLLWTLISLLSSVEDSFNSIWRVRSKRTFFRKITDYLAILLILPIVMICAGGLQLMVSSAISSLLPFDVLKPAITVMIDSASFLLTCLFFAGSYMMIPNAKVNFKNALLAGLVVGIAFHVLQWLFVTGQMYVAKYNAIYGSFSFLPLFLIWMQLVWLMTLIGGLLCYASQNVGLFNFSDDVAHMSRDYYCETTLAITAIIVKRFLAGLPPMEAMDLAKTYDIPQNLTIMVATRLVDAGLVALMQSDDNEHPLIPAIDVSELTAGDLMRRLNTHGTSGFIPGFSERYAAAVECMDRIRDAMIAAGADTKIKDIDIKI